MVSAHASAGFQWLHVALRALDAAFYLAIVATTFFLLPVLFLLSTGGISRLSNFVLHAARANTPEESLQAGIYFGVLALFLSLITLLTYISRNALRSRLSRTPTSI